ncbi:FecR family protein [Terrimonas pollutisoli]|uniref:FecR family protein n=1 Tax=Terrimonas pollutisoli TaxID=3034147 RepID=UPI0023ED9768|nr:FecR family protein [Terrimonas sp. H1YJ31]
MSDKLPNERIWELLAKKLSREISQDELDELHALLQKHSYVSYVDEVLGHEWRDSYTYYQPDKTSRLFENHQQRLAMAMRENDVVPTLPADQGRRGVIKRIWQYAAAACVVVAFLAAWRWWSQDNKDNAEQRIAYQQQLVTQKGDRSQIVLPDGSKVWLNAGSTLDYPKQFTGKTRDVQLQGEAYFEVTEDSKKPFFVHTNAFYIKVLGTGFNVRAYADEDSAVTALVHGSVEVILSGKEKRTIRLRPNEKITLPMNAVASAESEKSTENPTMLLDGISPEKMTMVEDTVQLETAWVNNKLAFKKLPLVDVAAMLEKWFGVDIRFKNEARKAVKLSGVYDGENLDYILYTLEATGTFHYTKDTNNVIWIE